MKPEAEWIADIVNLMSFFNGTSYVELRGLPLVELRMIQREAVRIQEARNKAVKDI